MKKKFRRYLTKTLLICSLLCVSQLLFSTFPSEYYWGNSYTPIRVSLNYATNNTRYKIGDIETINFRIYINKSDTLGYEPGHEYFIKLDPLMRTATYDTSWITISTTVKENFVILNDEKWEYSGSFSVQRKKRPEYLNLWIDTYRITYEAHNEVGVKYDNIPHSDYRADQHNRIIFRNPIVYFIYLDYRNSIDCDIKIQEELKRKIDEGNRIRD